MSNALSILVVDDDTVFQTFFASMITKTGYEVDLDQRYDYVSAMEAIKNHKFSAIFLDYYLPDGTGLEIAQEARQLGIEIPIIMVTSQKLVNMPNIYSAMKSKVVDELFSKSALSSETLKDLLSAVKEINSGIISR